MKNWLAKLKPASKSAEGAAPDAAPSPPPTAAVAPRSKQSAPKPDTPEPKKSRKRQGRRARSRGGLAPVLGLYVTPQTIYGLLMRREGEGFEVVRRVTRKRAAEAPDSGNSPDELLADIRTDDVAIQFGEAGINMGADMFVGSEFGGLSDVSETTFDGATAPAVASTAQPIVLELKDLIEECRSGSLDSPRLAFCLESSDVAYAELRVDSASKGKSLFNFSKDKKEDKAEDEAKANSKAAKRAESVKAETLIELLPDHLKAQAQDPERVAFLPMTPRDGLPRFLAVVPEPSDPVTPSVELLREQEGMRGVRMTLLSAEIPALMGLTRQVFPMGAQGNTAIVRVGAEDTLVMLLVGDVLHHAEYMRSVTTFDGPDTICSRVLLQQDVQGVGNVDQVIVLAEEREEELVN
ncbi:MAG: hypothetical protein AAGG50_13600, partial [Bacteroidota bacterium]